MYKTITTTLLAFAFSASLLFAQGPGNPPDPATAAQRRVQFLTRLLSLTASQQQQATTIFTSAITSGSTIRTSLRTAHQSLNDAVTKNDIAGIDQQSATIGNLTAQMTSIDAKADAAFYQILTPDQQAKFTQMQSRGRGMMGGMGMGPAGRRGRP
jgi:Spy/CpxP family protein refolding chaperone